MSIFWTSSGSCPLCLTPPCYHLGPPATAALFSFVARSNQPRNRCWQLCRNFWRRAAGLSGGCARCWARV